MIYARDSKRALDDGTGTFSCQAVIGQVLCTRVVQLEMVLNEVGGERQMWARIGQNNAPNSEMDGGGLLTKLELSSETTVSSVMLPEVFSPFRAVSLNSG